MYICHIKSKLFGFNTASVDSVDDGWDDIFTGTLIVRNMYSVDFQSKSKYYLMVYGNMPNRKHNGEKGSASCL